MTNFVAVSAEMQQQRDADYAPMGPHAAACLAETLDYIIDNANTGRSAISSQEGVSERCEREVLMGASRHHDSDWAWPPTTLRMNVRRDISENGIFAGDNYTIILETLTHRNDIADPSITRAFSLMIPRDSTSEDPQLLVCYQPSLTVGSVNGAPAEVSTIVSAYHEADVQLDRDFYRWGTGTEYDADMLFDELAMLVDILPHHPGYVWESDSNSNATKAPEAPIPPISRLPQGLIATLFEEL